MADINTIKVLVLEEEEPLPGRRAVPGAGVVGAKVLDVPLDAVKQAIGDVTRQVREIVKAAPEEDGSVSLDEISVDLNIEANGSVQWVAGIGGAVGSTLTLTYRVDQQG